MHFKPSKIVGPYTPGDPEFFNPNNFTVVEQRFLNVMYPGRYYSARELSKLANSDLTTISEGMKRLYKKNLISAFFLFDNDKRNGRTYIVYSLKNSRKILSDDYQIKKTPSSSSSSLSDSESDTDIIYPLSKVVIRYSSDKNSLCREVN